MLCEHCHKETAVVSYILSIGDQEKEMHLCQHCLEKLMTEDLALKKNIDEGLAGVLGAMLQMMSQGQEEKTSGKECPQCHTSWQEFKETGLLGCSKCYEVFGEDLKKIIYQFHGNTQHRGAMPSHLEEDDYQSRKLLDLKEALKEAVDLENYEKAAELRDEINRLKEEANESN